MSDGEERVERRGRKTKEEEAWAFLAEKGITPETIDRLKAADSGKAPQSFAEMLDLAAADLWADYHQLRGTAKVQAFRAISALAKDEGGAGGEKGDDPLIADVLAGIVPLPKERRDEILRRELGRLDEERARIVEVLEA